MTEDKESPDYWLVTCEDCGIQFDYFGIHFDHFGNEFLTYCKECKHEDN